MKLKQIRKRHQFKTINEVPKLASTNFLPFVEIARRTIGNRQKTKLHVYNGALPGGY